MKLRDVILNAEDIFHRNRWKYGIVYCPYCGSLHIKDYGDYHYKCNSCKNRFTDKTNTLLHNSKLSVSIWMQAIYELVTDNFISSVKLGKRLGINQKSAWLLRMKLDYAMSLDDVKLTGNIAQDEMYVGGCLTNYHYSRKISLLRKNNLMGEDDKRFTKSAIFALNSLLKQPVFGMNDGKSIVLYATPNPIKKKYIHNIYKKHVVGDSIVVSDESKLYDDWEEVTGSKIYTNNHHNNQYKTAEGLTSNRIENTFSWFKRGYNGRITHSKYLQLYLNEFCFRYNHSNPFEAVLGCMDKIVTYNHIKECKQTSKRKRHIYTLSDIKDMFENPMIASIKIGKTVYYRKDFI